MDRRRAALDISDVPGMFRQATASFKASLPLFLTLALLSSVYEMAIERSALLPGLSFSSQSSNFSFQFALDPKSQAAQSPHNAIDAGGRGKIDTPESFLSRLFTVLLPPDDQASHHTVVQQEPQAENKEQLQSTTVSSSLSINIEGDTAVSEDSQDEEHLPGSSSTPSAAYSDEKYTSENHEEVDGKDESKTRHQDGRTELGVTSTIGGNLGDVDLHLDQDPEDTGKVQDDIDDLPRLKIEIISNETRKVTPDSVIDAIDLTFFTGKLLGGRGLDQGALPHGGLTILLIFLLVAVAVTIFLAIVGFEHAAVLGSVAFSVVSTHMGKQISARQAIKSSLKSSIGRLMWLAILHATLRGLQSLLFMKTLFGGVMEMEQVESLVLRISASPFAILAPLMDVDAINLRMAVRIGLFVCFDYLFDGIAYCIYIVACWVTILEINYWGLGAVTRSYNLVKGMEWQAVVIRVIEAMVCGRTARWLLQHLIGQFAAASLICIAQMFFLVLWLIFYMSARSFHDQPSHFSYRTLEDFLDRFK